MPRKCYILRCDSNSNKSSKYTPIFSFPKEKERRTLWIAAVREQYPELGDQDPGITPFYANLTTINSNVSKPLTQPIKSPDVSFYYWRAKQMFSF